MGDYLKENSVPLQLMHDTYELPQGQVLEASVFEEGFDRELNALFYVEAGSEHDSKLELGIIDEVSIGALSKHANCSSCGFDFFKNEKTKMQLMWDRACDNEHVIGQDGVHLVCDGLDSWKELSLVNKGASSKPKILTSDKSKLSGEQLAQIAASGVHPEMFDLNATVSPRPEKPTENSLMDEKLLAQFTEAQQQIGGLNAQLTASAETIATQKTRIIELEAELEASKTDPSEKEIELTASVDALTLELNDVKTSENQMKAFITEHYKKACALLSQEVKDNADLQLMLDTVNDARLALHQIPVNGASEGANTPKSAPTFLASNAFQTKK